MVQLCTLYHANLSEKLIQERNSHQCLKALRQYEQTSDSQLVEVSNIIKVQAPAVSSVAWNELKMEICKQDKEVKCDNYSYAARCSWYCNTS